MEKITKYVKFSYALKDQDLINILDKYINSHAEEIFNFFDSTLPRNLVNIKIISTKSEYDEIIKKRSKKQIIPAWEIGNCYNGTIEYVSFHDYNNTLHAFSLEKYEENLEYYKKTILHEYIHYVLKLYTEKYKGTALKYLNEGIAQYLSGQRDNIKKNIFNYSLNDILKGNDCYLGWYLMVKYILENYGKEYYLRLILDNELAISETPKLYDESKKYYQKLKK